jgi:hypothetical protein
MRFIVKSAVAVVVSLVLLGAMQVLVEGTHCFDCGARVGFPFAYMQEGTFATHGQMIWSGFALDCAIALGVAIIAISLVWRGVASLRRRG